MPILPFEVASYKPYRQPTWLQLRPLTVLIGMNQSGKSALMKALPPLAGSLASNSSRPLDREASGLLHGFKNSDLVSGRTPHGAFELGLESPSGTAPAPKPYAPKSSASAVSPASPTPLWSKTSSSLPWAGLFADAARKLIPPAIRADGPTSPVVAACHPRADLRNPKSGKKEQAQLRRLRDHISPCSILAA